MKEDNKYKALYLSRNLGEFLFYIYLPLYLKNLDYSGTMIGTVLSFSPLFLVIALPIWSKVENIMMRKHIIILAAALTVSLQYFFLIPSNFIVISIITVIYSLSRAPLYPSIDSLATLYCLEKNIEFSSLRSWGSFGYLLAVVIGGFLFDKIAFIWLVIISTAVFILLIYTSHTINPLNVDIDKTDDKKRKGNLKQLMKNPFFIKFLLAQILCYTAIVVNNSFDILYLTDRKVATYLFAVITSGRIAFEILCFRLLKKNNFSYKTLFAAVPVLMIIQSVFYFINAPVLVLFSCILFTGTAVGIIIYLNNKYIAQIVRPKNITLATYITALIQNFSAAIFIFLGGIVFDKLGPNFIYLFTGISFVTGFIFIIIFIKKTGRFTVVKYYD